MSWSSYAIAVAPSARFDESPLPCPRCCTLATERLADPAHPEPLYSASNAVTRGANANDEFRPSRVQGAFKLSRFSTRFKSPLSTRPILTIKLRMRPAMVPSVDNAPGEPLAVAQHLANFVAVT